MGPRAHAAPGPSTVESLREADSSERGEDAPARERLLTLKDYEIPGFDNPSDPPPDCDILHRMVLDAEAIGTCQRR